MSSLCHELSTVKNKNAIGIANCGQAMGHNQRSAIGREFFQRLLDEGFTFRIKSTGGFVKEQDGSVP